MFPTYKTKKEIEELESKGHKVTTFGAFFKRENLHTDESLKNFYNHTNVENDEEIIEVCIDNIL